MQQLTRGELESQRMLVPLLLMMLAFTLYFGAVMLTRARGEVLRRERSARWISEDRS